MIGTMLFSRARMPQKENARYGKPCERGTIILVPVQLSVIDFIVHISQTFEATV